ncbi:Exodeoxyribonuclease III protein [Dioscorea alata]|uniref:Exodeoxyribonuclease III protein n=1 Tax=Dioscorea alata TaxID=55571 RepID=A0ACB7WH12_DIOAL|nr:Exodeoxyribonuclease III protein [Dioscorea alata]
MKVLSWNVRGLGRPSKRHLINDFLTSTKADLVCLQETKLQELHTSMWKSIGSRHLDSFHFLPASGTSGGIIMAWDKNLLSGSLIHSGVFSLTLEFSNRLDNSVWLCTSVYGPNARSLRSDFWNELRLIRNLRSSPWVICGDFNVMFSLNDKNTEIHNLGDLVNAQIFLNELNLIDPPLHGRGFTWTNGQEVPIWERLDRFLFSQCWSTTFPKFGALPSRPRTFRFEKSWYSDENVGALIQNWWSEINPVGCGAFILSKKLMFLKGKLRKWASESFGSLRLHKNSLLLELNSLDSLSENRPLSVDESARLAHIRSDLSSTLRQEELHWKQRSRITWLKDGDSNTKFFHLVANGRRNKNFIPRIRHNGGWVEGNLNLGLAFADHFRLLFGTLLLLLRLPLLVPSVITVQLALSILLVKSFPKF